MLAFVSSWGFTVAAVGFITFVFCIAFVSLGRELRFVRSLTDFLGYDAARRAGSEVAKPPATIALDAVRDQVDAVLAAGDPAAEQRQIRSWEMRAHRLEPALAFWVDFLRQLGLLFTVVGLGLSLAVGGAAAEELLRPLSLAVWTTVAGLFYSIWLSAQFGMKVTVWADTCEKNIEAWTARRLGER